MRRAGKTKVRLSNNVTEISADGTDVVVRKTGKRGRPKKSAAASTKTIEKDPLALPTLKKRKSVSASPSPKKKARGRPATKPKKTVLTKAARKQPAEPEEYEVESIVDHRAQGVDMSYRIRWKGWSSKDDTWQLESELSCEKLLREYKERIRSGKKPSSAPSTPKKKGGRPSVKAVAAKSPKASPKKRGRPSTKTAGLKGVAKGRVTKKTKAADTGLTKAGRPKKKPGRKPKSDVEWEVEEIVAVRTTEKGKEEFLVKWKNYSSEENTWEPAENVANCSVAIGKFRQAQDGGAAAGEEGEDANAAGDAEDDKEEDGDGDEDKHDTTAATEASNGDGKEEAAAEEEDDDENSN